MALAQPQGPQARPTRPEAEAEDAVGGGTTAEDAPHTDAPLPVAVDVTRSGGFAGRTRRWRAEPGAAEAPEWIDLIRRCPWESGAESESPAGADRFVWWIRARCGSEDDRETELPDDAVTGAWRDLVDAVRDFARAAGGATGDGAASGRTDRAS